MLIGTLNQAIAAVNAMSRAEVAALTAELESSESIRCGDRRKKREFCTRSIILMWDVARWEMIRHIYNAQEQ